MKRNTLSRKFKAALGKQGWNEICPPNEYRVLSHQDALNAGIIPASMTDVNTVIIGASGSFDNTIIYFANYCRIDHDEIDQEPYIELYESGSSLPSLNGILHHADFNDRTELLDQDQLSRIAASGSTADIQFTAKPDKIEGTLDELRTQGKIDGFNYAHGQGMKLI